MASYVGEKNIESMKRDFPEFDETSYRDRGCEGD